MPTHLGAGARSFYPAVNPAKRARHQEAGQGPHTAHKRPGYAILEPYHRKEGEGTHTGTHGHTDTAQNTRPGKLADNVAHARTRAQILPDIIENHGAGIPGNCTRIYCPLHIVMTWCTISLPGSIRHYHKQYILYRRMSRGGIVKDTGRQLIVGLIIRNLKPTVRTFTELSPGTM